MSLSMTAAEEKCVAHLKATFPAGSVDPADADFLCDQTYLCYARGFEANVDKAQKMLAATLQWRKEYKPYAITIKDVELAMQKGTQVCGGRCREGRPVLCMTVAVPNPCDAATRTKQLVYILETFRRKGYRDITWVADFGQMGKHKRDPYSKETRKQAMHILQSHYPERLGRMLVIQLPWYANILLRCVRPFLHPRTAAKIVILRKAKDLLDYIDESQLPVSLGGTMSTARENALEQLPDYADGAHDVSDKEAQ